MMDKAFKEHISANLQIKIINVKIVLIEYVPVIKEQRELHLS